MGKYVMVAALLLLASAQLDAQAKLVADPYPGSVAIRLSEQAGSYKGHGIASYQAGFLSRDDPSKVIAHYKPKAQKELPQADGSRMLVIDEWPSGGEMGPHQACVHVFMRVSEEEKDLPVFERLLDNVHAGQHTQAEWDKVYAKYKHLNNAFFELSSTKSKRGNVLDVQEALYAQYDRRLKAETDSLENIGKDVGKKIQELVKQGEMAEAGELMKQMSGMAVSSSKKDRWPMWMEFLEKVNQEVYSTLMIIDQGRGR